MRFLEYLFFKYYNWAIKVGDGDIPSFTSVCCMALFIMLYAVDITMTYYFFISPQTPFNFGKYYFSIFGIVTLVLLYVILVIKGKDKQIMEAHKEEWTGKKHLVAILFPTIAFVWFAVALLIKASINSRI